MAKYKKNEHIRIGLTCDRDRCEGRIVRWENTQAGNLKITIAKDKDGYTRMYMGKRSDLVIEKLEE
jgi:hypothetical protein